MFSEENSHSLGMDTVKIERDLTITRNPVMCY